MQGDDGRIVMGGERVRDKKNEDEDHERNWDWVRWTRKTKGENAKAGERWGRIRRRG